MKNQKSRIRSRDKSITEGYLAGAAALMITILWMLEGSFHPLIIFTLFLISLSCISLSTLWLIAKEKTIKEYFQSQPSRYAIVGFIILALIVLFFIALFALR